MNREQYINISSISIDEEDSTIEFLIELSNGTSSTCMEFYGYTDEFQDFADELCSFPKTINHEVKLELGKQDQKWAYYMLLRVYCYETNGYTAIQIKTDNNRTQPYKNCCEFNILTVPASINKLGEKLKKWNPTIDDKIEWIAE